LWLSIYVTLNEKIKKFKEEERRGKKMIYLFRKMLENDID